MICELTDDKLNRILEEMDWSEIEGGKVVIKNTIGDTILEIEEGEILEMLAVFIDVVLKKN